MIVPEKRTRGVILAFYERYYSIFASFLQRHNYYLVLAKNIIYKSSPSVNHSTYSYNEK